MKSVKAQESVARVQQHTPLFENPEITAMAAICEILQELPDDDARLRVMRWSFGRFSSEFKRPLPPQPTTDATRAPLPLVPAGPRVARESDPAEDATALDVRAVLTVAPELDVDRSVDHADFAGQISELHDLFPARQKADAAIDWAPALTR